MTKRAFFLPIIWLSPLWAIAQTYNYAPSTVVNPLLVAKNDATLSAGWSRGNNMRALEIQGGYALTRHLAVMAQYMGAHDRSAQKKEDEGTNYYMIEGAVGLFEAFPKGGASVFAGFGSGPLFSHYGFEKTARFQIQKWFVQPGVTYRSDRFQAGMALRLSRLSYPKGVVSFSLDADDLLYIQNIEQDKPVLLPEMGLHAGVFLKPFTISIHTTSIFPDTQQWGFVRMNVSVVLTAYLGKASASKKEVSPEKNR